MASKHWTAALFFLVLLAGPSWATYDADQVLKTSCRVVALGSGLRDEVGRPIDPNGSGNIVANNGHECVVYTVAHVLEGGRSVMVEPWRGQRYNAKVLTSDMRRDVAILTFVHGGRYRAKVPEIAEDVSQGEVLYGFGYGGRQPGQPPRHLKAQVRATREQFGRVLTTQYSISGDSGAVLYSANTGKAVAVTHGFNPYGGLAVPVEAFQEQITRGRLFSGFFRGGST